MYYVTWNFHVKSAQVSNALEPWMMLSSPWRMSLIFFIAGAATAIMMRGKSDGLMLLRRTRHLLLPLLAGVLLVVPPQTWLEVVQKHHFSGSFLEFLKLYYSGYPGFCAAGSCLVMPTWNHLWFLPYLWSYTVLLWLWMRIHPSGLFGMAQWLRPLGWYGLPFGVLLALHLSLSARYPQAYDWIHDWFSHAQFLFFYLLGAVFTHRVDLWAWFGARRHLSLALALTAWALFLLSYGSLPRGLGQTLLVIEQWFALLAALGYGYRHLNRDHPWRATLTEAVFPFYIFHQTWLIVLTQALRPLKWQPGLEGPVIVLLTFVLSGLSYVVVRRLGVLRTWFGMDRVPFGEAPRRAH
jgi:glucan biosynthesis protein C